METYSRAGENEGIMLNYVESYNLALRDLRVIQI